MVLLRERVVISLRSNGRLRSIVEHHNRKMHSLGLSARLLVRLSPYFLE
jgi:hypothetical protein